MGDNKAQTYRKLTPTTSNNILGGWELVFPSGDIPNGVFDYDTLSNNDFYKVSVFDIFVN